MYFGVIFWLISAPVFAHCVYTVVLTGDCSPLSVLAGLVCSVILAWHAALLFARTPVPVVLEPICVLMGGSLLMWGYQETHAVGLLGCCIIIGHFRKMVGYDTYYPFLPK